MYIYTHFRSLEEISEVSRAQTLCISLGNREKNRLADHMSRVRENFLMIALRLRRTAAIRSGKTYLAAL